jgi:hypothetical protein
MKDTNMNVESLIQDIEGHPIIAAILFFLVAFFGINFFKKSTPTSTPSTSSTSTAVKPDVEETYNQVFYSQPFYNQTQPTQTPVVTPPPVTNPCKPGYHFEPTPNHVGLLQPHFLIANNGSYYVNGGVCVPDNPIIPITPPPVTTPTPPPIVTPPITPPKPVTPPPVTKKYVTVTHWPDKLSTLFGIAQANGLTLSQIEALNPQIHNPNLIYAGQQVRVK